MVGSLPSAASAVCFNFGLVIGVGGRKSVGRGANNRIKTNGGIVNAASSLAAVAKEVVNHTDHEDRVNRMSRA